MQPQFIALSFDQFVAMLAVQVLASNPEMTSEAAVDKAMDVYAEASVQHNNGAVMARINAKNPEFLAEQRAKMEAAQRGLLIAGMPLTHRS